MTTDNRTNEPTDEQVKAASKAHRKHGKGDEYVGIVCRECDEYFEDRAGFDAHRMRAALVAAAGAASGAESEPKSTYINPSLPGMIRNLWRSDPSENSVRTALKLAGDLIQELIDLRAAPVLPSSTVDEALRFCTCSHWLEAHHDRKCLEHHCACVNFQPALQVSESDLAEVIRLALQDDNLREIHGVPIGVPKHVVVARRVAAALGGESRG